MRLSHRLVATVLSIALSVPLAAPAAAQQPPMPSSLSAEVMPPPPPPPPGTPPPPPPPTAQPELYQETLKVRSSERHAFWYGAGAALTNVFLIPGRTVTCAVGGAIGVALLVVTLGTGYRAAASAWGEGCGGKWVVTGDDLRPDSPRSSSYD